MPETITTPREQLVKIMQDTLRCDLDEEGCSEHESDATDTGQCEFATYIANAILAAGWQPPIPEQPNTLTNN